MSPSHPPRRGGSGGRRRPSGSGPTTRGTDPSIAPLHPTLEPPDIRSFREWNLGDEIQGAIEAMGITSPTPIQRLAIQHVLDGRDVIAKAETGTGKTLAFGAGMMAKIDPARASVLGLVLCPTRELAEQVQKVLEVLGRARGVKVALVVGGEPLEPQVAALKGGAQVVVGTPGRILDLYKQRFLSFPWTEFTILDEADVMLEIGFIDDVKQILSYAPDERQTLLFSATFPPELLKLAREYTKNPVEIATASGVSTVDTIEQSWIECDEEDRPLALTRLIEQSPAEDVFLVFCDRRTEVDKLMRRLERLPFSIKALHGGYDQAARFRVMSAFRTGEVKVLVATDVASRGLDVKHVTTVVNYGSPQDITDYTHRIGRTGRAGRKGRAITLVGRMDMTRRWRPLQRAATWDIPQVELPGPSRGGGRRDAPRREFEERPVEARRDEPAGVETEVVPRARRDEPNRAPREDAGRSRRSAAPREDSPREPRGARDEAQRETRGDVGRETRGDAGRETRGDSGRGTRGDSARGERRDTARAPRDAGAREPRDVAPRAGRDEVSTGAAPRRDGDRGPARTRDEGRADARNEGRATARNEGRADARHESRADARSEVRGDARREPRRAERPLDERRRETPRAAWPSDERAPRGAAPAPTEAHWPADEDAHVEATRHREVRPNRESPRPPAPPREARSPARESRGPAERESRAASPERESRAPSAPRAARGDDRSRPRDDRPRAPEAPRGAGDGRRRGADAPAQGRGPREDARPTHGRDASAAPRRRPESSESRSAAPVRAAGAPDRGGRDERPSRPPSRSAQGSRRDTAPPAIEERPPGTFERPLSGGLLGHSARRPSAPPPRTSSDRRPRRGP